MQIKLSIYLILSVFKPFYNYPSFATTLYNDKNVFIVWHLCIYQAQSVPVKKAMK